jgi:hypothetical protein
VFTESLHSNGRGADRSEFIGALFVAQQRTINAALLLLHAFYVFTESLPSNALAIHVTIY